MPWSRSAGPTRSRPATTAGSAPRRSSTRIGTTPRWPRPTATNLARTIWTEGRARKFPELVLYPRAEPGLVAVEGSVVDRAGRSVPDVAVWIATDAGTPIRTASDVLGRFRLEGVPPRRSFLFAEAQGFRFFGRLLDPGAGSVSIELTRPDERPTGPMRTLPPPRPRAEERALARRLILPYVERLLKDGGPARGWPVAGAGRPRVLRPGAGAGDRRPRDPRRPSSPLDLRRAMWEDGRAEAMAVIEAMPDGEWRARGHLAASRAIPADRAPGPDRSGRPGAGAGPRHREPGTTASAGSVRSPGVTSTWARSRRGGCCSARPCRRPARCRRRGRAASCAACSPRSWRGSTRPPRWS